VAERLDPAAGQAGVSRAESLLFGVALYYALANGVDTAARAWSAVTWLLVAGLGVAAVGMVSVSWLDKYPILTPVFPRLITTIPHPTLQSAVHPNELAAVLLLFVFLALGVLAATQVPSDEAADQEAPDPAGANPPGAVADHMAPPRWLRPLAAVTLTVTGVLVVLTQSRGAWLALAAVALTWLVVRRPDVLKVLVPAAVVVGLTVAAFGPRTVLEHVGVLPHQVATPTPAPGAAAPAEVAAAPASPGPAALPGAGRLRLWAEAAELLAQSPATGIGLNAFPLVHGRRPEYQGGYVYQGAAHAHNTLLQAALDYGLFGFVAVVGLYMAVGWSAYRAHHRLAGTALALVVVGLALGLAAQALHGLVDALAIGAKPGFLVWAFAGVLAGIRANARRWVERRPSPPAPSPNTGRGGRMESG
jgi:hypothetical protein